MTYNLTLISLSLQSEKVSASLFPLLSFYNVVHEYSYANLILSVTELPPFVTLRLLSIVVCLLALCVPSTARIIWSETVVFQRWASVPKWVKVIQGIIILIISARQKRTGENTWEYNLLLLTVHVYVMHFHIFWFNCSLFIFLQQKYKEFGKNNEHTFCCGNTKWYLYNESAKCE